MQYNGWTLYDKVTLVIKQLDNPLGANRCRYDIPQAYLVNSWDKKQLERAINWGTYSRVVIDKDGNYVRGEDGIVQYETVEPRIVELENKGFTVELLDYAHMSSQGGALSFWNCIIRNEKENIECVIGIAANLLLALLKWADFSKGKCKSEVVFARQSGNVGLLAEGMKEYEDAVKDMDKKKEMSKGKTSKWKIGHAYETLTNSEFYFGDIYSLIKSDYYSTKCKCNYYIETENKHYDMIVKSRNIDENIKKASELKESIPKKLDKVINELKDNFYYSVGNDLQPLFCRYYTQANDKGKFPCRKEAERFIEEDVNFKEMFDEIIDTVQKKVIECIHNNPDMNGKAFIIEEILVRTTPFTDELTENEKELLRILKDGAVSITEKGNGYALSEELEEMIDKL